MRYSALCLKFCGGFLLFCEKADGEADCRFRKFIPWCEQFGHVRYSKLNQKNLFTYSMVLLFDQVFCKMVHGSPHMSPQFRVAETPEVQRAYALHVGTSARAIRTTITRNVADPTAAGCDGSAGYVLSCMHCAPYNYFVEPALAAQLCYRYFGDD
jgi:hypothetical protein